MEKDGHEDKTAMTSPASFDPGNMATPPSQPKRTAWDDGDDASVTVINFSKKPKYEKSTHPDAFPADKNNTTKKNVKQFAKLYESSYSLANYMGVDIQNGKYLFCMSNSFICLPNGIIVCRTVCDCPYKMANTFLYGKLFD